MESAEPSFEHDLWAGVGCGAPREKHRLPFNMSARKKD